MSFKDVQTELQALTSLRKLNDIYDEHLNYCTDCNYDKDCIACSVPVEDCHNCNCHNPKSDNGYGYHLRQSIKILRTRIKTLVND